MERAYTLKEIDDLRKVVREHYLWQWYHGPVFPTFEATDTLSYGRSGSSRMSRVFNEKDIEKAVEERVRTFMVAGMTADKILEEESESYRSACVAEAIRLKSQYGILKGK